MFPMGQILLLATCAFLCLTLGADALKCRQCISLDPNDPCEPVKECDITSDEETCFALTSYFNAKLEHTILGCKQKMYANCGTTFNIRKQGISFEYACCEDQDFCNEA